MQTALQKKVTQVLAEVGRSERGIAGYAKDGHYFQVEREEYAKACEYRAMALDNSGNQYVRDHAALDCAHSIRARGKP